ncbi:hypothetical protein, conserved [Leishmania tarentolae]|uniref:Uncharacterized protein n=1 Tax=Leishmania tarentolae TaxID=5689 RepID=A0A640KQ61_LEITA|nr:hypothetical protein, conserved [Leishmania tarentolae]
MRGNLYSRGFDPMKSRSERRKEKQAKLAKTKRVIRLKRRLGRITARKFAGQEDSHMTALMESYILRRKAERAAEKANGALNDCPGAPGGSPTAGPDGDANVSDMYEDEGSDSLSLGSGTDSAFEMHDADDEEQDDVSNSRCRSEKRTQAALVRGGSGAGCGTIPRRRVESLTVKTHTTAPLGKQGRGAGTGEGAQGMRGRYSAQRGGRGRGRGGPSAQKRQNTSRKESVHERSRKVATRSLY